MGYKLVSGMMTQATGQENTGFYFDLRNANGAINSQIVANTVWECTEQPEMVAFCAYNYSYTNAVIELEIYDITEMKNNPVYKEVQDEYAVPGYFSSHMATQITKIQTAINAGKTVNYGTDIETFVFITDVHWANNKKNSPALIKEILDKTSIKTVICGGDLIGGHNSTKEGALEEIHGFTNSITGIPCYDYYAVYGNHDNNGNSNDDISIKLTPEEEYNSLYAPFAEKANVHWIWEDYPDVFTGSVIKNDYYFDHPRTRTRYICIDWKNPFQNTNRATWLTSVLSKDDGYRVVVIYHGMYAGSEFTPEHTQIMQYIEPYKNEVVAVITGHTHADNVIDYFGDGSVPVIITSCDTFDPTHNTGMVAGTYTEQCFDVFVIDYTNSKIKIIRIGNGSDREVNISLS
jgi:predicted phosphodiesterase